MRTLSAGPILRGGGGNAEYLTENLTLGNHGKTDRLVNDYGLKQWIATGSVGSAACHACAL